MKWFTDLVVSVAQQFHPTEGRPTWNKYLSKQRIQSDGSVPTGRSPDSEIRSPACRDWDRIVFSEEFRRLHDKAQVFPLNRHDSIHSRLTHSLEVASVGRSLGTLVGATLKKRGELPEDWAPRDIGDVVAAACVAHDIGNPPFGHAGENAIRSYFADTIGGGAGTRLGLTQDQVDALLNFEGNAQGFRILTRLAWSGKGLGLTATTLATYLKYPTTKGGGGRVWNKKNGVGLTEWNFATDVANATGMLWKPDLRRHPLAWLVEAADDICYGVLDVEDGARLKIVSKEEAGAAMREVILKVKTHGKDEPAKDADIGHLRATLINALVFEVGERYQLNRDSLESGEYSSRLLSSGDEDVLKPLSKLAKRCFADDRVLEVELAGYEALMRLLHRIAPSALILCRTPIATVRHVFGGYGRVPNEDEAKKVMKRLGISIEEDDTAFDGLQKAVDYVAGMTDRYAVHLDNKLNGTGIE